MGKPFLQAHHRFKNGKDHCYWSIVEKVLGPHGDWVQRPILYLGEINDSQKAAWIKTIEVFDTDRQALVQLALFPLQREVPAHVTDAVQVRLSEFSLHRPRQWGACWVACLLWQQLQLDAFWSERLHASREGTDWKSILQVLGIYRLLDRAANGACTDSGGQAPRWMSYWDCLGKCSIRIVFTVVWTNGSSIGNPCSSICAAVGRTSLGRNSTCCS